MSKQKNQLNQLKMFKSDPFYTKLNLSSQELRKRARELADFLAVIKKKPNSMLSLIKSLQALTTIPIHTIDQGIDRVRLDYFNLNKDISSNNTSPFDEDYLKEFIQKAEKFNQEAQHLLTEAVTLYQSICGSHTR